MKFARFVIGAIILSAIIFSCRQHYIPAILSTATTNYLVVDGIVNSSNTDSTFIKLSRTVTLNSKTATKAEAKAKVTVESETNVSYPLKEIKTGTYACAPLGLNNAAKYRLRIITVDNKTYLSDFVPVKEAPAIDSVGYTLPPNGVQVYVNAHDATNNTRYYRYEYIETWNFHSAFVSNFMAVGNTIVCRPPDKQITSCWANNNSPDITLASSAKLTKDVLFQVPVAFVPAQSQKLSIKYSILVKQYALTEEAFGFWQQVKKNTEQLGNIFDAQPSQINGNIHNTGNATEPVFGYISVGTFQQKRIFIDYVKDLPFTWGRDTSAFAGCEQTTVFQADYPVAFYNGTYIPTYTKTPPPTCNDLPGFVYGAYPACVDCTLKGTNKKPSYWQ